MYESPYTTPVYPQNDLLQQIERALIATAPAELRCGGCGDCGTCLPPVTISKDGLSAYEVWLSAGNNGTINDFFDSLVGNNVAAVVADYLAANPITGGNPVREFDFVDKGPGEPVPHNLGTIYLDVIAFWPDGQRNWSVSAKPLIDGITVVANPNVAGLTMDNDGSTFTGKLMVQALKANGSSGGSGGGGNTGPITDFATLQQALDAPIAPGNQYFVTVGPATYRKVGAIGTNPAGLYMMQSTDLITTTNN